MWRLATAAELGFVLLESFHTRLMRLGLLTPEKATKSEIALWLGLVLGLALADWLEHISRPYDVFFSIVWGWLLFTVASYAFGSLITSVFVGVIYGMIFKHMVTLSASWRHMAKYGSALLGVFFSAILFPSSSSVLRNLFVPEFKRVFSIDGASVLIILLVFTCLWYVVYRFPWRWNLRPYRYSAFLLLLFVFTANGVFGYFNNIRLHRASLEQSGIYSIHDGQGHFRLAKVLRISAMEIALTIADTQFTVRPTINRFPNIESWFDGSRTNQQTVAINVYNFLDWEPRLLAEGSIPPP
jgi:hypothetical protein